MHAFNTEIVFEFKKFNSFASENSNNDRHNYLKIVLIELCLMQRVPACGNI